MLYKFINENLIEGSSLVIKRIVDGEEYLVSNPEATYLKENGWKEFEDTPYPDTEEGYTRTCSYAENNNKIVKVWSDPIKIDTATAEDA